MPLTVAVMTVDELVRATDPAGLVWRRFDAWQELPTTPGVYFWAGLPSPGAREEHGDDRSPSEDDGIAEHAEDAVLYVGKGNPSLRARHRQVWPYASHLGDDPETHGHARVIRRHSGVLFAAPISSCPEAGCMAGHGAETWERRLLTLHLRRTGLVPVINGGAWWSNHPRVEQARTWAATAPV